MQEVLQAWLTLMLYSQLIRLCFTTYQQFRASDKKMDLLKDSTDTLGKFISSAAIRFKFLAL